MNDNARKDDRDLYKELDAAIRAYCISRRAVRDGFLNTVGNDTEIYFGTEPTLDFSPSTETNFGSEGQNPFLGID